MFRPVFFKVLFSLLIVFPFGSLAFGYPPCSNGSDPDGDGWGWENDESCKVYPSCSSQASDPDGDNWGSENGSTCVVFQTCSSRSVDPNNDSWGWENGESCSVHGHFRDGSLSNRYADQQTKNVYSYLKGLPDGKSNRVMSGAFGGYSGITGSDAFSLSESDEIYSWTGQRPKIYACDYAQGWSTAQNPTDLIDYSCNNTLKELFNKEGGLVQISNHLPSPVPGNGGGLNDQIQNSEYAKILEEGHAIRSRWLSILDEVAAGLMDLQDAGVTVIYRPLHEMNGEWFWWGNTGYNANDAARRDLYKLVYADMFNYFTNVKGLNNLIWVYSPDAKRDFKLEFYPGYQIVDVVGLDVYTDSPTDSDVISGYNLLTGLGKPFSFAEIGPDTATQGNYDYKSLIEAISSHYPETTYFLAWNSVWSPTENVGPWYLYNDDWTLNLGEN